MLLQLAVALLLGAEAVQLGTNTLPNQQHERNQQSSRPLIPPPHPRQVSESEREQQQQSIPLIPPLHRSESSLLPEVPLEITVCTFNMLAAGLENDGFLTEHGYEKDVKWEDGRGERVLGVLENMLETCDVVTTQENDEYFGLLKQMTGSVGGVYALKVAPGKKGNPGVSNARAIRLKGMLAHYHAAGKVDTQHQAFVLEVLGDATRKAMSPKDLAKKFEEIYAVVNHINKKPDAVFPTFQQQAGLLYAEGFAAIYGKQPSDVYISDDGIGIYWKKGRKFEQFKAGERLKKVSKVPVGGELVGEVPVFFNEEGWVDVVLETSEGYAFTLFGAHLKSGEEVGEEEKRVVGLEQILAAAQEAVNPVVAMDSNTSFEYLLGFLQDLRKAFEKREEELKIETGKIRSVVETVVGSAFSDGVPVQGFECFKMRSMRTDQPKKACQPMFDKIDAVLYAVNSFENVERAYLQHEFGFTKYPWAYHFAQLHEMRISPEGRQEFEKKCRAQGAERTRRGEKPSDLSSHMFGPTDPSTETFTHIYPGQRSPSDHPPVAVTLRVLETSTPKQISSEQLTEKRKKDLARIPYPSVVEFVELKLKGLGARQEPSE